MILLSALITRREAPWALYPEAPRGYLAGEQDPSGDPGDGLVTSDGDPAARWVYVFHMVGDQVGPLVATAFSNADGEWRVDDLPADDRYLLMVMDHTATYAPTARAYKQPYT